MARLPKVGGDRGNWGVILNEYLSQAHDDDGTLKDNSVTSNTIAPGAVTKSTVGLSNVNNTSDEDKPVSTAAQSALDAKQDVGTLATDVAAHVSDGSALETALDTAIAETVESAAALPPHKVADDDNEPRGVISWTFDDGYSAAVPYFALMDTRGITGTLFLTKNWVNQAGTNSTWNDTYITQSEVQTIADNGHEIGTHGLNHESVVAYRGTNGDAALAALYDSLADYIEGTYGVEVKTGAYPAGASDRRTREIMGRRHDFFRGTKGSAAVDAWNPYDVPAVDVQTLTEAAIKLKIDEAVANNSLCVFLIHGEPAASQAALMTKLGNCMDYATSLGVRQLRFAEAMTERTQRRSPGAMDDTSGNAFRRRLRTHRLTVTRDDHLTDSAYIEMDLVNNAPYLDGVTSAFEIRGGGLRVTGTRFETGRQRDYSATTTSGSPTITAITGFTADDKVLGITVTGTGIPAGTHVGGYTASTISMDDGSGNPVNATASGTVIITLGYPTPPVSKFYERAEFHNTNPRSVGTASSTGFDVYNLAGTRTARFSASKLERVASGTFTIDTAGGNLELEAARVKFQPDGGSAYLSFSPTQPSDGSIASSEQVVYPVPTTGAAKYAIRGKEAGGTVRQIQLNMTPVALAAAGTDAATVQTLVNDIRAKLIATGMYS